MNSDNNNQEKEYTRVNHCVNIHESRGNIIWVNVFDIMHVLP